MEMDEPWEDEGKKKGNPLIGLVKWIGKGIWGILCLVGFFIILGMVAKLAWLLFLYGWGWI
jgi:hypothetical protein